MLPTTRTITIHGRSFTVRDDPEDREFWDLVTPGKWEPQTFRVFDRFLDAEHSYIDVGAWIGPTVLYGAQLAKRCYALEPDPLAFGKLLQNLALNPGLAVSVAQTCLERYSGTVRLGNRSRLGDSVSSRLFANADVTWESSSVTIEDYVRQFDIRDCSFIKMDIEGAEPNALRGAHDTLARWKPRISISAYHQPDHPVVIPKIIRETRPDYKMECGPCAEANGHIRPDILYFR